MVRTQVMCDFLPNVRAKMVYCSVHAQPVAVNRAWCSRSNLLSDEFFTPANPISQTTIPQNCITCKKKYVSNKDVHYSTEIYESN